MNKNSLIEEFFHKEIRILVTQHSLKFNINPGGGSFYHPEFGRCQVSNRNKRDDYSRLAKWLITKVGTSRMEEEFKGCWVSRGVHDLSDVTEEYIKNRYKSLAKWDKKFEDFKNQREMDRKADWKDKSIDYLKSVIEDKFRYNHSWDSLDTPSRSLYTKEYIERAKQELERRNQK